MKSESVRVLTKPIIALSKDSKGSYLSPIVGRRWQYREFGPKSTVNVKVIDSV